MLEIINNILNGDVTKAATIIELLKIFLATSALIIALFTLYTKDDRLRASTENILVALIFFLISTLLIIFSLFIVSLASKAYFFMILVFVLVFSALIIYICALCFLLFNVFFRSYNQIYNLRTDKMWRYFMPVKFIFKLKKYKSYELQVIDRKVDGDTFKCIRQFFSDSEIDSVAKGASILMTGESSKNTVDLLLDFVNERLSKNETINYVSADCHPYEIWKSLKDKYEITAAMRNSLVFIDAFTPSFGFTDEIYDEYSESLSKEGVKFVRAKTFAGLHSKVAVAFNLIKQNEKKAGLGNRRPMTMIYSHTSSLCDFESIEQYRIFWRHVISSERIYGMTLFIVEDTLVGDEILNPIKQRVNFILELQKSDTGELNLIRKK